MIIHVCAIDSAKNFGVVREVHADAQTSDAGRTESWRKTFFVVIDLGTVSVEFLRSLSAILSDDP